MTGLITRRKLLAASGMIGASTFFHHASAMERGAMLFDGKGLKGWQYFVDGSPAAIPDHVSVRNGNLHFLADMHIPSGEVPFGYLATVESFSNFHLQLQYKWGTARFAPRILAKRNSGIMYHLSPNPEPGKQQAIEFQVQESNVGDIVAINTRGLEAPAPGGTPVWPDWPVWAQRDYAIPSVNGGISRQWIRGTGNFEKLNEWNQIDIIVYRDQAAHIVNGRIVAAIYGLQGVPQNAALGMTSLHEGRIALQIEAAEISFRQIRLRPISHPLDVML